MLAMVRVWNFSLLLPARIFLLKFGISIITQTTKVCILGDKGKPTFFLIVTLILCQKCETVSKPTVIVYILYKYFIQLYC